VGLGGLINLVQEEEPVTASCDHGNGSLGSIKSREVKKMKFYLAFAISFTKKIFVCVSVFVCVCVCVCVCMYVCMYVTELIYY
jgi:hypothetical protein